MKLVCNVNKNDRIFRVILGVLLLYGAFYGTQRFFIIVAVVLIITGAVGQCGLYRLLDKLKWSPRTYSGATYGWTITRRCFLLWSCLNDTIFRVRLAHFIVRDRCERYREKGWGVNLVQLAARWTVDRARCRVHVHCVPSNVRCTGVHVWTGLVFHFD